MVGRFGATVVLAVVAATASAAEEPAATTDNGRNAIYLQAGFASGSSDMGGAAIGGTVIRDLGSRLALEGPARS